MFFNDLGVYLGVLHDIQIQVQDSVRRHKCFWNAQPANRGIVQGPFKPLGRSGEGTVQGRHHEKRLNAQIRSQRMGLRL